MTLYDLVLYPTGTAYVELDTVLTSPSNRILLNPRGAGGPTVPFTIIASTSSYFLGNGFLTLNGTSGKTVYVDWGDSNTTTVALDGNPKYIDHTYANSGTYNASLTGDTDFLSEISFAGFNIGLLYSISNTPSSVTVLACNTSNANSVISGSLNSLPSNLTYFGLYGRISTITGSIENLPSTITYFGFNATGTANSNVTGSIENLPCTSATALQILGMTGISGSISSLPLPNLDDFYFSSNSSSISGQFNSLPSSVTSVRIEVQPNISGSISSLASGITNFQISNLSSSCTGSISSLPTGLINLSIQTCGTNFTGSISSLPSTLKTLYMYNVGNSINGSIASLPSGLTFCYIGHSSASTMTLSNANLASIPSGLTYFQLDNLNPGVLSYTSGRTWASNFNSLIINPTSNGIGTSTAMDNIIIDLDATTWSGNKVLTAAGTNAARTSASNSAYTDLTTVKGVTVSVNGP